MVNSMPGTHTALEAVKDAVVANWARLVLGIVSISVFIACWASAAFYLSESGNSLSPYLPGPLPSLLAWAIIRTGMSRFACFWMAGGAPR